jgi:hypothetical protein
LESGDFKRAANEQIVLGHLINRLAGLLLLKVSPFVKQKIAGHSEYRQGRARLNMFTWTESRCKTAEVAHDETAGYPWKKRLLSGKPKKAITAYQQD